MDDYDDMKVMSCDDSANPGNEANELKFDLLLLLLGSLALLAAAALERGGRGTKLERPGRQPFASPQGVCLKKNQQLSKNEKLFLQI